MAGGRAAIARLSDHERSPSKVLEAESVSRGEACRARGTSSGDRRPSAPTVPTVVNCCSVAAQSSGRDEDDVR
jgi:hypothetical protein